MTIARGFPSALYCPDCGMLAGVFSTQKGLWAPIPDGVLVWQCGAWDDRTPSPRKSLDSRERMPYITDIGRAIRPAADGTEATP